MLLQTWSSTPERENFMASMANVNTLLRYIIGQRRRMIRYAVEDDMNDSSESNSSSDDSSL
jgi:hypothetical protein